MLNAKVNEVWCVQAEESQVEHDYISTLGSAVRGQLIKQLWLWEHFQQPKWLAAA